MEVKKYNPIGFLSNFWLKIIAIITMTIDHIGLLFFPKLIILRIIGRLAFPIFAFLIAEGCSYTKNKLKRFLLMLFVGIAYLLVYYFYSNKIYGSIFVTFTFSIFFIFLIKDIKKVYIENKYSLALFLTIILSVLLILTYKLFEKVNIDAKFVGMLVPVFVSLFDFRNLNVSIFWKKFDCLWVKIICLAIGLLIFGIEFKYLNIQFYCMCSLFFIVFYNGKLGYKGAKYGFYVYYPMHLIVLEGINLFI